MALATTCPQCKTSFKVIPDQLKLRRGLVRCGVCQHVFSGIDYLRYVDESGKARPVGGSDGGAPGTGSDRPPGRGPERGQTRSAGPSAGSAGTPAAPQTVIAADDELKTAFFLSDSTFGPFTQARPDSGTAGQSPATGSPAAGSPAARSSVLPPAGSDFARDFVNEGTTRIGPLAPRSDSRARNDRADDRSGHRPADRHPEPGRSRPPSPAATPATAPMATGDDSSARGPSSGRAATVPAARESARPPSRATPLPDGPEPPPPARRGSRRSLLDDDDADVAAANALARQARESLRGRDGRRPAGRSSSRRRGSGLGSALSSFDFRDVGDYFSDTRRAGIVIGLGILLLLQLLLAFRGELVSRMPSTRPALEVLAGIFGMNVDTVRNLSSLSIESFELQNTARSDQIALNAVLRNRDGHVVRWPAMVLTLSDPAGAIVVRKVILPSDYLNRSAPRDGLGGRSEWPIRLRLETGSMQLAGYSVALFYP